MVRFVKDRLVLILIALWILIALTLSVWQSNAFAGMVMTPGTPTHTHSDGNTGGNAISAATVTATGAISGGSIATSGALSSTKACAALHTRTDPNYCRIDTASSLSLTRDTCTLVYTLPIGAKGVGLMVRAVAISANAVNQRSTSFSYYINATCTTSVASLLLNLPNAWANEFVATLGATLSVVDTFVQVLSATDVYAIMQDDAGNQGSGSITVLGYYD